MCLSVVGELDDYDRLRRSANEHWRTMQYYFDEAAAAYGRGERCRAAALSEKVRDPSSLSVTLLNSVKLTAA
jgi:hypothetical protein